MAKFCGKDFLIQIAYALVAWTPSTLYAVGATVSNSGNGYRCKVGGTSAASGGPSTTVSTPIIDGTATWEYIGAATSGFAYRQAAGMKSNSLSINTETVDVTDKGDGTVGNTGLRMRELAQCGVRSMELSGSGYLTDLFTSKDLVQYAFDGAVKRFRLISGNGDKYEGLFQVNKLDRAGDYNAAETVSLSFSSADTITFTPA